MGAVESGLRRHAPARVSGAYRLAKVASVPPPRCAFRDGLITSIRSAKPTNVSAIWKKLGARKAPALASSIRLTRLPSIQFDVQVIGTFRDFRAFFTFAHRFRCAAAIRARDSGLRVRFFGSVWVAGLALVIHFRGRPRPFPRPVVMRSSTMIACSTLSRSAFNSASIFERSISESVLQIGRHIRKMIPRPRRRAVAAHQRLRMP
jgi:hypothetical protein